jgi:four helix bundle protein
MGRNFKDLIAWQRADDLAVAVYQLTRNFPPAETYGLRSQIRRSAISVGANIAEGSGKRTLRERRACYDDSMGELNEIEYYIHLSQRLGYFKPEDAADLETARAEAARPLAGLLKMLEREITAAA